LVFGLLVVGCGGSDGVGGEASAKQVNADCLANTKKAVAGLKKAYRAAYAEGFASEREEIQFEVSVLMPMLIADAESQAEAIRSLDVPGGDETDVEGILSAYRQWIEKSTGTPLKVVVANDIYNEARARARKYGLAKCGVNPFDVLYG
jgi:hypothetical protein